MARNKNPFVKAPVDHVYSRDKTCMVRIPIKTRDALVELATARDLEESLGQLITVLQRQATEAIEPQPTIKD